jgi:hypothetical protein
MLPEPLATSSACYGFGGDAALHSSLRPSVRQARRLGADWKQIRVGEERTGPPAPHPRRNNRLLYPATSGLALHPPHEPLLGAGPTPEQFGAARLQAVHTPSNLRPVRAGFEADAHATVAGSSAYTPDISSRRPRAPQLPRSSTNSLRVYARQVGSRARWFTPHWSIPTWSPTATEVCSGAGKIILACRAHWVTVRR